MNFTKIAAFFLLILAVYLSFSTLKPSYQPDADLTKNKFSVDRALIHVKALSKTQHAVGFPGHTQVREYIISELKKMGLEVTVQEGYAIGDGGNFCKAINILARIKGTENGKALALLSHYDSSPHSSYGASDAASGVATILEGVRAFVQENESPKNDIIILISDAEELGLNGAKLFVNEHPWAKEVGLVLNFEARGSGGPSYMLVETNGGNHPLIEEFKKANPKYPVANSLAYSIYKMLPNDTDLTVFREDGDIQGFNFAFIDDHYDYHTSLDNYDRLDRSSLAHQGSYLMPLLAYFSQADLNNLKSVGDSVYFNIPFFKLISYPFEWIWPIFGLACLCFVFLLIKALKTGKLNIKKVLLGFLPVLIVLVLNGFLGQVSWPALKWWYPYYEDTLCGFTFNGHWYILSFTFLALSICFFVYHGYKKIGVENLLVAPLFIWLLICGAVSYFLKGASFFIIPVFGFLAAFLVFINQKRPNPFLLLFLSLPAIFLYSPFIKMFPVGLGLKMMITATLTTTLLFFLLLPFLGLLKKNLTMSVLSFFLFAICGISAHLNSRFSLTHPKPSSLVYIYDDDKDMAMWATYDKFLVGWNGQFLEKSIASENNDSTYSFNSKYSSKFTKISKAPKKNISPPEIVVTKDTLIDNSRMLTILITPKRLVNRLEIFTNDALVEEASINSLPLSKKYLQNRKNGKLITHFISDNEHTEIDLRIPKSEKLELIVYEASNDLLTNPLFSVPERPETNIPMPFVLNDAIIVTKKIKFE